MDQDQPAIVQARPTDAFTHVNGLKLHYLDWGTRRATERHSNQRSLKPAATTIVQCHGGSAHCHWWDAVAP
jgi:pimeloyl-ACP methyl ester carboxylesterase